MPASRRGAKGHPDQSPAYVRKQAVAVILAAKVKLRIEERSPDEFLAY